MLAQKQAPKPPSKAPARWDSPAPVKHFTLRHLWRLTVWGGVAAVALLLAVLTTQSELGSERMAGLLSPLHGSAPAQAAARPFDAQAETQRLAAQVRGLTAENDGLKSRLAAVEQNVDDITGTIARQAQAAKGERGPPSGDSPTPAGTSLPPDAAAIPPTASTVPPTAPSASSPTVPLPLQAVVPDTPVPEGQKRQYGVDIGSAPSIQALRARWLGVHAAHPDLFRGMKPTALLRESPRSHQVELRLVIGPLPSPDAASRLCASLVQSHLFCQPAPFDSQHVALE